MCNYLSEMSIWIELTFACAINTFCIFIRDLLQKHGVCIRVLGNIKLLPGDIQEMIAEAILLTKNNNRYAFNISTVLQFKSIKHVGFTIFFCVKCNEIDDCQLEISDNVPLPLERLNSH